MAAFRSTSWYHGVLLGGITLVVTAVLAGSHAVTSPAVEAMRRADLNQSLEQVVPAALRDNDMTGDTVSLAAPDGPVTVYRARKGGRINAVAYRVTGQGYGGPIVLVMGVSRDGEILGVQVVRHSETPGLGDRIDPRKSPWLAAFSGRSLTDTPEAQWAVKKDGGRFDQFSGATVSPRAVVGAVHAGLLLFRDNRARLLGEAAEGTAAPAPVPARPVKERLPS